MCLWLEIPIITGIVKFYIVPPISINCLSAFHAADEVNFSPTNYRFFFFFLH